MILFLDTVSPLPMFSIIEENKVIESIQIQNENSKKISDCIIPAYFTLHNQLQINDKIKKLIVCTGPGSFTALRVGIAFMYGLSVSKRISLISISCTDLLKFAVLKVDEKKTLMIICSSNDQNFIITSSNKSGKYLIDKIGLSEMFVNRLTEFGFSSIANVIASIKIAKYMKLGKDDAIITVATDGSELYQSELEKTKKTFSGIFDAIACENIFKKYIKEENTDNMIELSKNEKERIFNLGYYTWVEQQGIKLEDFEIRRHQSFWDDHMKNLLKLDSKIEHFNNII